MRIALCIEYDGSLYCGWQSQSSRCGVQDYIEAAIAKVAGHAVRVHVAGRTDTGVHALAQIIHFDTESLRLNNAWVRGVNAFLPKQIVVKWAHEVDPEFHARYEAQRRSYQYLLYNHTTRPALMANQVGWFHDVLNEAQMQAAINHFLGVHDFSAFRAAECQAKSPIKHLTQAEIVRKGDYYLFNFSANAFLHHQIRNMVGALIYVGKGALKPIQIKALLDSKDRTQAPPTFSAHGLYLTGVTYDEKWKLPNTHYCLTKNYLSLLL